MRQQVLACAAEGRPYGQFAVPGGAANQHQVGDIGAGDQQHHDDGNQNEQQCGADVAHGFVLQSQDADGGVGVGRRVRLFELSRDALHFRSRLFDRDTRRQACNSIGIDAVAAAGLVIVLNRCPKGRMTREIETGRSDADDLSRAGTQPDG